MSWSLAISCDLVWSMRHGDVLPRLHAPQVAPRQASMMHRSSRRSWEADMQRQQRISSPDKTCKWWCSSAAVYRYVADDPFHPNALKNMLFSSQVGHIRWLRVMMKDSAVFCICSHVIWASHINSRQIGGSEDKRRHLHLLRHWCSSNINA